MDLRRFLGLPHETGQDGGREPAAERPRHAGGTPGMADRAPAAGTRAETDTVRQIVARLDSLPPERARLLASMAYILSRAAYADLEISDVESAAIERILVDDAGLDEAQAVLVSGMAKIQARSFGSTEDYLVTREFKSISTPEQRLGLLRACFVVGASDDEITASESATLNEIANELDVDREALAKLRGEYADRFAAQRMVPRRDR